MNKIYKLVWSKVRNMYVAVSELAKSRTKASGRSGIARTVVAGVLACLLSCGAVMPVYAIEFIGNDTDTNHKVLDNINYGAIDYSEGLLPSDFKQQLIEAQGNNDSFNSDSDVSFMVQTDADNNLFCYVRAFLVNGGSNFFKLSLDEVPSFVLDDLNKNRSFASYGAIRQFNDSSITLGLGSKATSDKSIAVGNNDIVRGTGAVAIGNDIVYSALPPETWTIYPYPGRRTSYDENHSIGGATTVGSIAIGNNISVREEKTIGIGQDVLTKGYKGIAIGSGSSSNSEKAIALGSDSNGLGDLSVAIGPNSISSYKSVALGTGALAYNSRSIAIGADSQALMIPYGMELNEYVQTGSVAIGADSKALSNLSIAVGDNAVAEEGKAWAISVGANSYSGLLGAHAIGYGSKAYGKNSVALGRQAITGTDTSEKLRPAPSSFVGSDETVGTNAVSVGYLALASANNAMAMGYKSTATGENAMAFGSGNINTDSDFTDSLTIASAKNSLAVGFNTKVSGEGSVAIGSNSSATGANSIVLGAGSSSAEDNVLAVGSASNRRRIVNVKEGVLSKTSTDAVTGSQLYATNQNIAGFASDIRKNKDNITNLNTSVTAALESVSATSSLVNTIDALKADASLNNLTAAGQQVISNAAANAVQEYMKANGLTANNENNNSSSQNSAVNNLLMTSKNYSLNMDDMLRTSLATGNGAGLLSAGNFSKISADNIEAVTGADVYAYLKEMGLARDGKFIYYPNRANDGSDVILGNASVTDSADGGVVDSVIIGTGASIESESCYLYNSIAIGTGAKVHAYGDSSSDSIAIGSGAYVGYNNSIAIGAGSRTSTVYAIAIGDSSSVSGGNSVALGSDVIVDGMDSVAIGSGSFADKAEVVSLGYNAGNAAYDVYKWPTSVTSFGGKYNSSGFASVQIGSGSLSPGEKAASLGNNAVALGEKSVAIGALSVAHEIDTVSFGHNSTDIDIYGDDYGKDYYRRLTHVADGIDDHDVATVGQLKKISGGKTYNSGTGIAIDTDDNIHVKNVLMYDSDSNDTASMAGASGTKLTNLKQATLSNTSTDAVTGSQLFATNQNIAGFASDIKKNKDNISNLNSSVTAALESVSASSSLVDTLNNTKADASLNNLTATGQQVIKNTAIDALQEYIATQEDTRKSVEANTEPMLMRSVPLMRSVNPVPADTNYVVYDDNIANRITLEGENGTVIGNLADGVNNDEAVNVGQLSAVKSELEGRVKGTEDLLAGDWDGFTVKEHLDTKADKSSVYTKTETDGLLADKADVSYVDNGLALKADKDSVYTKLEADSLFVNQDEMKDALEKKADRDASNIDVQAWSDKLATGEIESGNTGLVNGGTVYEAISRINGSDMIVADYDTASVRIASDGRYDGLDVVDISKSDGTGRVLAGVITNPDDKTSAANVGYVEAVGQNVANAVSNRFNQMDNKVNKVGASAAALAALTPASFEGDEKWSLAASVGNYRDATAGAIGAFYRPAENVMMNVRGSFGNSENMVAAGIAVALNKGDIPGVTKRQLAKAVTELRVEREADKAALASQANEIEELRAMVHEMAMRMNERKESNVK